MRLTTINLKSQSEIITVGS